MSDKLIGSFYFRKTSNGNLLGEFINNQSGVVTAQCAYRCIGSDNFAGEYYTFWDDTHTHSAMLSIDFTFPGQNRIYTLEWSENGVPLYIGEGFLSDENTLIGFYLQPS